MKSEVDKLRTKYRQRRLNNLNSQSSAVGLDSRRVSPFSLMQWRFVEDNKAMRSRQ